MEKKNAWEKYPEGKKRDEVFSFAEDYRKFISDCKTERECTSAVYKAVSYTHLILGCDNIHTCAGYIFDQYIADADRGSHRNVFKSIYDIKYFFFWNITCCFAGNHRNV